MKTIYLFDVDGTLTAPRQEMTDAFAEFFMCFVNREDVFLVSGSNYEKLQEQVPQMILDACHGVFGCAGAQLVEKGKITYERKHVFSPELLKVAENFVDQSKFKLRCGNHIEHRTGMLNISSIGRDASLAERHQYHQWDSVENERAKFVEQLNKDFRDYEASCGGEISIDIVPLGWNKSVVKGEVLNRFPNSRLVFFGDRMGEGGNDQPLADVLNTPSGRHAAILVKNYKDTWMHLNHIKDAFNMDEVSNPKSTLWESQTHQTMQ